MQLIESNERVAGELDRLGFSEAAKTAADAILAQAQKKQVHLKTIQLEGTTTPIGIGFTLRGLAPADYWLEPEGRTSMLVHTLHEHPKVTNVSPEDFRDAFVLWVNQEERIPPMVPIIPDGPQNALEVADLFK